MKHQLLTSIRINATAETVWNILTDFEQYPNWNPFVKSLTGKVKKGNQIQVKLQNMNFQPIVVSYQHNKEFKWLGHLWMKGLFDGEHQFKLTDNGDGTTTFEQNEYFNGILVKPFLKMIENDTKKGFIQMNEQLKARAENQDF